MSAARIIQLNPAREEAQSVLDYKAPPRCPDEILTSGLPDWCVRVWLAVRAIQGNNAQTECGTDYIAARSGKSRSRVSRALAVLEETGWVEKVHDGRPPHYRCHIGRDAAAEIEAAVKGNTGRNGGGKEAARKVRAAHDSERTLRAAHDQSARRAHSPDTPYKEQSSIESEEVEGTRARDLADLPDGVRRYHQQIRALMGASDTARRQAFYRALRAGNVPRAEVVALITEAEETYGRLAAVAAITVTANEAESRFTGPLQNHFKTVLQQIGAHAERAALPPDPKTDEQPRTPSRGGADRNRSAHGGTGSVLSRLAQSAAESEAILRAGAVGFDPNGGEGGGAR